MYIYTKSWTIHTIQNVEEKIEKEEDKNRSRREKKRVILPFLWLSVSRCAFCALFAFCLLFGVFGRLSLLFFSLLLLLLLLLLNIIIHVCFDEAPLPPPPLPPSKPRKLKKNVSQSKIWVLLSFCWALWRYAMLHCNTRTVDVYCM